MTDQSNKSDGAVKRDGEARDVDDRQAVKNHSIGTPEGYPEPAAGDTAKPE